MENEEGKRRDAILLVEWMGTGLPTQAEIEEEARAWGRDYGVEYVWDYLADVATERGITSEQTEVRA